MIEDWTFDHETLIHKWTGFRIKHLLGSGSFGSVFSTNNDNIAIKVTSHYCEAQTLAFIQKLRSRGMILPGIININSLVHFKDKYCNVNRWSSSTREENLFIIVRELLSPLDYDVIPHPLSNTIFNKEVYERSITNCFDKYPEIKLTLQKLMKKGVYLWDVKQRNVGVRKDGAVVIHDVVAEQPLPKLTIPSYGAVK